MKKLIIFVALSVFFGTIAVGNANMIANGSFEAPVVVNNAGTWQLFTTIDNWENLTNPGADTRLELQANGLYSGFTAADGNQWIELAASNPTAIGQFITTDMDKLYRLSFSFSGRPNVQLNSQQLMVQAFDWHGSSATSTGIFSNLLTATSSNWTTYSYDFRNTTGTNTLIMFQDWYQLGDNTISVGTLLDNVSVAPVPEPGTLLLLGSGLVGLAYLKRRKKA